jgi:tetratricopeptide (TPR) repeat protein
VIRGNAGKAHAVIAKRLFDDKKFREAARELHAASELDPATLDHVHGEGIALAQAGEDRDAALLFERVLEKEPDRRATIVALGHVLYRLGKLKDAIARFSRALELDAKDDDTRRALEKAKREASVEEELEEDLGAPHFTIRADGGKDARLARLVGSFLEDAYRDVGYDLGRYPKGEVPVVIYPRKAFRAVTGLHAWVAAAFDGKIRIPAEGLDRQDQKTARAVLVHEFTHALIRSIGGPDVPSWLHEGLAQLEEGRSRATARALIARAEVPPLDKLAASFTKEADEAKVEVRYAVALDFTAFLSDRASRRGLVDVLDRLGKGEKLDGAFEAVYGAKPAALFEEWRASLHVR